MSSTSKPRPKPTTLDDACRWIRREIIRSTTAAESGHPTSSLSAVELGVGLLFGGTFRADLRRPKNPDNDRFILSKGHAAPLLYALYAAAGAIPVRELTTLRKGTGRLEGHPMPNFPYAEIPTGSLGQGLSAGVGIALARRLDRRRYRTYVLLGDSEMAEGSVWEAIQFAGHARLDGLTAIIDVNRLGQSGPTMLGYNLRAYAERFRSFGWRTFIVDGHDLPALRQVYAKAARATGRPTVIIAKTVKGKGISAVENKNGWHGTPLTPAQAESAIRDLGSLPERLATRVPLPRGIQVKTASRPATAPPTFRRGQSVSPRQAVGETLTFLGSRQPELVVLDAEVKNSTFTELFEQRFPKRFIQTFIAEQNMAGIANGLASRGKLPALATFAAFLTRAFDQIRMSQYSQTPQIFIGTHPGISIGKDGASQMGLEDIAMFRTLGQSTILYPADATSASRLTEIALRQPRIAYLRATRAALPILYPAQTRFTIGGSHTLRQSRRDRATIVAAGITVHEALRAARQLASAGIPIRVIDLYSIKPIDTASLIRAARQTKRLIVVEDHRPEGGIAEAVRTAIGPLAGSVTSLAVNITPHSGTPEETMRAAGIDADGIVRAVRRAVARSK